MRNKYKNVGNFVICLKVPPISYTEMFNIATKTHQECGAFFTPGKKYKVIYFGPNCQIVIRNNYDADEIFNIHSPYGNCFCSLTYLRKKKLEVINEL